MAWQVSESRRGPEPPLRRLPGDTIVGEGVVIRSALPSAVAASRLLPLLHHRELVDIAGREKTLASLAALDPSSADRPSRLRQAARLADPVPGFFPAGRPYNPPGRPPADHPCGPAPFPAGQTSGPRPAGRPAGPDHFPFAAGGPCPRPGRRPAAGRPARPVPAWPGCSGRRQPTASDSVSVYPSPHKSRP